ncbi:MAG: hypothetical protein ACI4R8_02215 [Candidatus Caccovivens sp.]
MKSSFIEMLKKIGFVEENAEFFRLSLPLIYFEDNKRVEIYCFEKDENVFLSDGGSLLFYYDVPSIDFDTELDNIQKIFFNKNDFLKNGHILKQLTADPFTLEKEVSDFVKLIVRIEYYFEEL